MLSLKLFQKRTNLSILKCASDNFNSFHPAVNLARQNSAQLARQNLVLSQETQAVFESEPTFDC